MPTNPQASAALLDTSAVIAHMVGHPEISQHIRSAERCFLPLTALGELSHGIHKSQRRGHSEEDKPYTFWTNNDYDSDKGDDPNGSTPNSSDDTIIGIRDLEDFTRLHIDVSAILPMLKDNRYASTWEGDGKTVER